MLRDEDLAVLGYWEWLEGLQRGVAAHHAGMLPAFKEIVEELFQLKLLKVVFATETLALGVNMPARSVVLEKLEKFNGEARVPITPGEYTQLTGRAGRRGIDVEGHSVIQWVDGLDPEAVAALASRRSYPLNSSFRPTYNMAVNLDRPVRPRAHAGRSSSSRSRSSRPIERSSTSRGQLRKQEESMAGYEEAMRCHLGDFAEYAALRRRIGELERQTSKGNADARPARADAARARRGPQGDAGAPVPRLRRTGAARAVGRALVAAQAGARPAVTADPHAHRAGREALRPGRRGARAARLPRARPAAARLVSTPAGRILKRIYGERDLLVAECLRQGLWDGLDVPSLAAMAAALVYEPRRDDRGEQFRLPRGRFREAFAPHAPTSGASSTTSNATTGCPEATSRRPRSPPRCTRGRAEPGSARCSPTPSSPRATSCASTKQVVDLLDQISIVADAELGSTARAAIDAVRRGVVAYGSVA